MRQTDRHREIVREKEKEGKRKRERVKDRQKERKKERKREREREIWVWERPVPAIVVENLASNLEELQTVLVNLMKMEDAMTIVDDR